MRTSSQVDVDSPLFFRGKRTIGNTRTHPGHLVPNVFVANSHWVPYVAIKKGHLSLE